MSSVAGVSSSSASIWSPVQSTAATASGTSSATELTDDELATVAELAVTDRKVRAHEQAHLAAAGPYSTGGASFTYAQGPDGQRYAVAGEVGLDASPDPSDPEKTIQKARVIQAAANAPADPSSQDRQVAAAAAQMEQAAQQQLAAQQRQILSAYSQAGEAAASTVSVFA